MTNHYAVGVDWSNGSWLGIVFSDGEYETACVEDDIADLYEAYETSLHRLLIDIPIGLFQHGDRDGEEELVRSCDAAARKAVGPRYRSVFNPPARDALEEKQDSDSYDSTKQTHEEVTGKGLQQQAYYISDAIYQVDQFLLDRKDLCDDSAVPYVAESHPEVCFRALAGQELSHPKQSAPGFAERLHALDQYLESPADTFLGICADILAEAETQADGDVDVDDVLDALALAIVASGPKSDIYRLPCEDPPRDESDLPMQMVYRAADELAVDLDYS